MTAATLAALGRVCARVRATIDHRRPSVRERVRVLLIAATTTTAEGDR